MCAVMMMVVMVMVMMMMFISEGYTPIKASHQSLNLIGVYQLA